MLCRYVCHVVPFHAMPCTGMAIYKGDNDFYQPLREILHPFKAISRILTPLYKSSSAKKQHKSAIILIWFWRYHAEDQAI